jgi:hypothetical protein
VTPSQVIAQKTKVYRNNANLKRAGVEIEYTPEQIAEYVKCANDITYFAKYIKIIHIDKGLISFEPFDYQRRMFETFDQARYSICKVGRQMGKSTAVIAFILHKVLFNEHYKTALLANKEAQAKELLARLQLAYEWLPTWLQQGVVEFSKKTIILENGSSIEAAATSSSAIRGKSMNLIYLDEFAHVQPNLQENFINSVFPVIASGTSSKIVITSTPKGMEQFYKIWMESVNGKNSFQRVEVNWDEYPGRDEAWKQKQIADTSERQFRQEFSCMFLGSAETLIDPTVLSRLVPANNYTTTNEVTIFAPPANNHNYAITVDVSEGLGQDYSALTVVDVSSVPYNVVATYANNLVSELTFPTLINNVARHYNDAAVLVEVNIGMQVINILHQDLEYENLIVTKHSGKKGTQVNSGEGRGISRFGLKQTKLTKKIGCANLKALVESDKLILNDIAIIQQLSTYEVDKNTYNAQQGHHDDLVMCLVMFSWMVSQNYFKDLTATDVRKRILEDNEKLIEQSVTPFFLINNNNPIADPTRLHG